MRTILAWQAKPVRRAALGPEREGAKNIVYDIAFRPDGLQLVAAVGMRVLVYDAVEGELLNSLKGHKEAVYCVAYSHDGSRFASGGADKQVIIWTSSAEGILKYAHTEPIQTLAYNPMTHQLASATSGDFGLWSAEARSVPKHKLPSRALCCSWTNDGQHLALGLYSGVVTIRDRHRPDVEKVRIERSSPVWSLMWNPSRAEQADVLAVACWDQSVSFHQLSGKQVGKDRELGYDPCCVSYFANGEYVVVGGASRGASLWTKDGVKLTQICARDSWVWTCKPRPKANFVAVGSQDGTIAMYQLQFHTVHGLYQERYAYRDNMTDVIVQHLLTDERVRIKCRDYVQKISVYKDRLAVQLPERILIYELAQDDESSDMSYRPCERINLTGRKLKCSLLVVTAAHVTLCHEKRMQALDYRGNLWLLDSEVRYVKVVGGEREREGLLLGLESGGVVKVFVDNPFPVQLVKLDAAVRCLDLSASRRKLAAVDENGLVRVYNLATGAVELEETGGNSVAWNAQMEEMLCYSGNGVLSIKTANFPLHTQKLQGFVVGFSGSKIFCLMKTVDVPQSASLYQFIERQDFAGAARVANLGVTEADWRTLGAEALRALELKVARAAFVRTKDMGLLNLVRRIEAMRKVPGQDDPALLTADVLAHQGRHQEAARLYAKSGRPERAVQLYTDLRQWDEARQYAGTAGLANNAELAKRQAEWAEEVKDWRAASASYLAAGDTLRAARVLGENGAAVQLAELVHSLPTSANEELVLCAAFLRKLGALDGARAAYAKLGDTAALVALAVEQGAWEEALELAASHPSHASLVYLPYADWLAVQDRFVEAQDAYRRAARPDKAVRMLEALAENATDEARFADAGYYLHLLALERLRAAAAAADEPAAAAALGAGRPRARNGGGGAGSGGVADEAARRDFFALRARSELYFAYSLVHRFSEEPFTTEPAETVFQCARFLVARTVRDTPRGLSRVAMLAALAKQSKALGAYKLSRHAYDKLGAYRLPPAWREQVELQAIAVRAKPFADSEELLVVCYRCQTTNPLLSQAGDECVACRHPF
ncbi:hypothetical protein T492DRAFT_870790, partial [Pavlovales sp. CCMP2436]